MTLDNIMRGWLLWCEAALAETVSATGERRGDSGGHRLSGAIHCRQGGRARRRRDGGTEGREAVYGHVIRDIGKGERKEESRRQERGRVGGQTLKTHGQQNLLCCSSIYLSWYQCQPSFTFENQFTICLLLFSLPLYI